MLMIPDGLKTYNNNKNNKTVTQQPVEYTSLTDS